MNMTSTESRNYLRGLGIVRMIPGLERIADSMGDAGLEQQAIEAYEGLALWDDELHAIGWVRGPSGWTYPPKMRCEAATIAGRA